MLSKPLFHLIAAWVLYSFLFTLLATVQSLIMPVTHADWTAFDNFLLLDIGRFMAQTLLLGITGFIIFSFVRLGLGRIAWFNAPDRGTVIRIGVFYFLMTASMLTTYVFAYNQLPLGVIIDLPILNAIACLIIGIIPYFRGTLFSPQE